MPRGLRSPVGTTFVGGGRGQGSGSSTAAILTSRVALDSAQTRAAWAGESGIPGRLRSPAEVRAQGLHPLSLRGRRCPAPGTWPCVVWVPRGPGPSGQGDSKCRGGCPWGLGPGLPRAPAKGSQTHPFTTTGHAPDVRHSSLSGSRSREAGIGISPGGLQPAPSFRAPATPPRPQPRFRGGWDPDPGPARAAASGPALPAEAQGPSAGCRAGAPRAGEPSQWRARGPGLGTSPWPCWNMAAPEAPPPSSTQGAQGAQGALGCWSPVCLCVSGGRGSCGKSVGLQSCARFPSAANLEVCWRPDRPGPATAGLL